MGFHYAVNFFGLFLNENDDKDHLKFILDVFIIFFFSVFFLLKIFITTEKNFYYHHFPEFLNFLVFFSKPKMSNNLRIVFFTVIYVSRIFFVHTACHNHCIFLPSGMSSAATNFKYGGAPLYF